MPNQTLHAAEAAVLVSRGANVLPAAPAHELYRSAARVGHIDRSGSPRLTQVSFNRHFALATPCAHVPGRYAEPSNFKIGIAHPWSWAIGSSTSAAQRSFDYGR
jgi:hypothetical protein